MALFSLLKSRQAILTYCLILFALIAKGQKEQSVQSPFFIIKSEDGQQVDQLPLKKTEIDVKIVGVIADITITQEYENTGTAKLEALYIFPASTQAAVYDMQMQIGGRKIIAEVQEKKQARETYEQAKSEGKTATLLEQHRPNVFQMSVGHVLPKDKISVTLKYTELLIPEEGKYEFVFPTVVGPRYADDFSQDLLASKNWLNNPYLKEGSKPTYDYKITTHINAGMPIHRVSSPSHEVEVAYAQKSQANISLSPKETEGGIKDYVLRYELGGSGLSTGLLKYEGEKENYFLAMIQPPEKPANHPMPPKEYVFILDVSGSMRGFPLDITKTILTELIAELRPQDRFNIMLFESSNAMLSPKSLPPSKANLKAAMELLDRLQGGGGTNLVPALKKALDMKETEGYSRSFVLVTDGYISVEQEVFEVIRSNLGKANVFAIGAGSSVNRFLIEGIGRAGEGQPLIVLSPEDAEAQAKKYQQYISKPLLTNIQVDFGGADVYDVTPLEIPDVMSSRPIVIFGKYRGELTGNIQLKGDTGKDPFSQSLSWQEAQASEGNQALQYLWARNKITVLSDYTNLNPSLELVEEVTKLGLDYNLLTNYTSFVAVDQLSRESAGEEYQVQQALPLPKGVTGSALGSSGIVSIPGSMQQGAANGTSRSVAEKEASTPSTTKVRGDIDAAVGIQWAMPRKQFAFAHQIALGWQVAEGELAESYVVTVKDFMGQELMKTETYDRVVDIDLLSPTFANVVGGLMMVSVHPKSKPEKKAELALELLKGQNAVDFLKEVSSLLLAKDVQSRLSLASYYERENMLANAFGVLRQLMASNSSEEVQKAYNGFLERRGWK